jgi:hypothetical protein
MTKTDGNLWRKVSPYLDEVLELAPTAREAWLANLEKAQPEVAHEVRDLLQLHTAVRESGFLER